MIVGRHANKVRDSVGAALEGVRDGSTIAVGGFGLCGNPEALIKGVVETGAANLHVVSNNAGNLGKGLALWLKAGIVGRVTCSYIGNNEDLQRMMKSGEVEVTLVPQGTLVERLRAAGAGIAGFYTPTGVGTVVAEGKDTRIFGGKEFLLEEALPVDLALLRAKRADSFGNLRFWRTAQNYMPVMASAAETAIAEVEELVALGDIGPDDVHLQGIFVHRLAVVAEHEDPFEYKTSRKRG
ncbi:MAG: CoA transferase subunit A [Myxococcales bacterium]|nr:CoA transferase subunit A [Myxococcales bacterium]